MGQERKYIGAGWIKQTDRGEYVSLSFNFDEIKGLDLANCWINLVINTKKAKPNHPDYNITAAVKAVLEPAPEPKQKQSSFPRPKNFAPGRDDGDPGF